MPLTRVRLYASGVGYFERRGRLHGEGDGLPVPASHLDDALKTLVERAFAVYNVTTGRGKPHTLTVREGLSASYAVTGLTREGLDAWIATETLPRSEHDVLRAAKPALERLDEARRQLAELKLELDAAAEDVKRLRADLKSLGSAQSGEAQTQLIRRIMQRDENVRTLQRRQGALTEDAERRLNALSDALAPLTPPTPA